MNWLSSAAKISSDIVSKILSKIFSGQRTSLLQMTENNASECIWENSIMPIAAQPHRKRIDSNLNNSVTIKVH